jgi:cytochrome P450
MQNAAVSSDARYEEIFSVEHEVTSRGDALVADPYSHFAALRSRGSVFPGSLSVEITGREIEHGFNSARPHISTLTFETCSKVLIENKRYSSHLYHEMPDIMFGIGNTVLTMVGDEHARHRASVQPMLTRQQAMTWWRHKWIDQLVDTLVSAFEQDGAADLSQQLCARLPMHTVTSAYGLGPEEALTFRENLMRSMTPTVTKADRDIAHGIVRTILLEAIRQRRETPQDDLISMMIASNHRDEDGQPSHLDDEAILSFSRLLLLAGGGTTYRQLGILLFALLSNREQLEALRADRALMSQAIEESLRWNCTDPLFFRLSTEDSVLDGHEIPAGAIINVCLGAANRDPSRWENPDVYDLHRKPQRHVGFAAGPHTCLGRFVAEAEMTVAVNALLDRLPKLRLDDRCEIPRIVGGLQARGVNHLRVRFD